MIMSHDDLTEEMGVLSKIVSRMRRGVGEWRKIKEKRGNKLRVSGDGLDHFQNELILIYTVLSDNYI